MIKFTHTIRFVVLFAGMQLLSFGSLATDPPRRLTGANLQEVLRYYQRAIRAGADSLNVLYAEALYHDRQYERAYEIYQKADSLNLVKTPLHKRNFIHAAKKTGKPLPFEYSTGYFNTSWQADVDVAPWCANSVREDFAPYLWKDILFITSSRQQSGRKYRYTGQPFLNIHAFTQDCQVQDNLNFLPGNINSRLHDGPLAINRDTTLLIITRNYPKANEHGDHNLFLEYYVRGMSGWSKPIVFPYAHINYSLQHPHYNESERTLYFSSDMPGGFGGFDLYKSKWNGMDWEKPVNLGPKINTPYDEVFPSFSPLGDLIYATNHIETYGGLDLVLFREDQRFLFPYPINTPNDDFTITFSSDQSGWFASNRGTTRFNDNIYSFSLSQWTTIPIATEAPLAEIPPQPDPEPEPIPEPEPMPTPVMEAQRDGFFVVYFDNDHPNPRSTSTTTNLDYRTTFDSFMLNEPSFLFNSASPRQDVDTFFREVEKGMQQLDWLASFLIQEFEKGHRYTIVFTSHASPRSNSRYNMILSQRRFASIENFLMRWNDGALRPFIEKGMLLYTNTPYGDTRAGTTMPADPAFSIYSVEASRERRVTIRWEKTQN